MRSRNVRIDETRSAFYFLNFQLSTVNLCGGVSLLSLL